jgi:hypothetical protein
MSGAGICVRNKNIEFTCPGSGNQTVVELSSYCKTNGGTPGNIRLAVYNNDWTAKICEGSAEVNVDSSEYGWRGHLVQSGITPNPTTLTGGVKYRIALTQDSTDVRFGYQLGSSGDIGYTWGDYTDGFPSSLTSGSDYTFRWCMRCGVESSQTYLDAPLSTAVSVTTLSDLATRLEVLSSLGITITILTELFGYVDSVLSTGVSVDELADHITFVHSLLETGVSVTSIEELAGTLESLLSTGVSVTSITQLYSLKDTLAEAGVSTTTIVDLATRMESLLATGVSTTSIVALANYVNTLLETGVSVTSISELFGTIEVLLSTGVSTTSTLDATGPAIVRYLSIIDKISAKKGMVKISALDGTVKISAKKGTTRIAA